MWVIGCVLCTDMCQVCVCINWCVYVHVYVLCMCVVECVLVTGVYMLFVDVGE